MMHLPIDVDYYDMKDYDGALLAEGFEDALVGLGFQYHTAIAVYDRARCIQILMTRCGMSDEDAEEYFSFNVIGAYAGPNTPVFITVLPVNHKH